MVTVAEALTEYNTQHKTNYATVAALGLDLAKAALKESWNSKLLNAAQEQAKIDTAGL